MNHIPPAAAAIPEGRIAATRHAIERLVRSAVPSFADFCLVHLRVRGALKPVAGAHATADGDRDLRALMRVHRIREDDEQSTAARVVRTGQPVLRAGIHPEPGEHRSRTRVDGLLGRLAPRSALVVPVAARQAVVGAVSLCYSRSGRSYAARDLAAARRLAARIADALLPGMPTDAALRLRSAARHARQGTTVRRRLVARN